MKFKECLEVLDYFCISHTVAVKDDTSFRTLPNGSRCKHVEEGVEEIVCNGIPFVEKQEPCSTYSRIEKLVSNGSVDCMYYMQQFNKREKIIIEDKVCFVQDFHSNGFDTRFTFKVIE